MILRPVVGHIYTVAGPRVIHKERACLIAISMGSARLRFLEGDSTGKEVDVPLSSLRKTVLRALTPESVLARVIKHAETGGHCRLCDAGTDETGKFLHEVVCPIPDCRKVIAKLTSKLPKNRSRKKKR